jgi:uracil-DNA glycosylase
MKNLFRAFRECPYQDLKAVIIGTDPYPQMGVADGIPFSCSLTGKEQPTLRYIFNAIEREYQLEDYKRNPDLKRWANQGVLMLNAALTCKIGVAGSHLAIWRPFTAYLLDVLNTDTRGIVFVFLGPEAREFMDLIGDHHYKITASDPSYVNPGGKWDNKNLFSEINKIIKENNNESINW